MRLSPSVYRLPHARYFVRTYTTTMKFAGLWFVANITIHRFNHAWNAQQQPQQKQQQQHTSARYKYILRT